MGNYRPPTSNTPQHYLSTHNSKGRSSSVKRSHTPAHTYIFPSKLVNKLVCSHHKGSINQKVCSKQSTYITPRQSQLHTGPICTTCVQVSRQNLQGIPLTKWFVWPLDLPKNGQSGRWFEARRLANQSRYEAFRMRNWYGAPSKQMDKPPSACFRRYPRKKGPPLWHKYPPLGSHTSKSSIRLKLN